MSRTIPAEQSLADRRCFKLKAAGWQAFQDVLDAPPRLLPRMKRLLTEPTPFTKPDAK